VVPRAYLQSLPFVVGLVHILYLTQPRGAKGTPYRVAFGLRLCPYSTMSHTELETEAKSDGAVLATVGALEEGDVNVQVPSARGTRSVRVVTEIPKAIRNQHMCIKFVYLVVYGLLMWLLYSLPSPMLWNKDGSVAAEYMSLLLFATGMSYLSLCFVQASNPGYIEVSGTIVLSPRGIRQRHSAFSAHESCLDWQGMRK